MQNYVSLQCHQKWNIEYTMIHEYMSSWKELITLSCIQSVKYAYG